MDAFEDYYKFLKIDPSADEQTIQAAFATARKKIEEVSLYPSYHKWVIETRPILTEAIEHLGDPARRQAYDTQRTLYYEEVRRSAADLDDHILWLDPPYIFYTDDPDPAYTISALAHKFDADWSPAMADINDQGLETTLHYIGQSLNNPQPYERLRQQIRQLRETHGAAHTRQMLESVIVLCDDTIERPVARINGQALEDVVIAPVVRRPDQPATISFQVEHGGPRGVLFGYLWLEETWGEITTPPLEQVTLDSQQRKVARFELAESVKQNVMVTIQPAQLMKLQRPAHYSLTLHLRLQPDTAHETRQQITLSLDLTTIPAKAQWTPSVIRLPTVRRGQPVSGVSALTNQGEQPLNARCSLVSDRSLVVTPLLLPAGGQVQVTVDTRGLREGSHYQQWIKFQADGDVPEITLQVEGEILPTAFQHLFRQKSSEKRLQSALGLGLAGAALSLFTLLATSGWFFWLLWILVTVLLTTSLAASATRSIITHIQAAGNTSITPASVPWDRFYLGVGGATALLSLTLAIAPLDPGTKTLISLLFFAFMGACCGFLLEESSPSKSAKPAS